MFLCVLGFPDNVTGKRDPLGFSTEAEMVDYIGVEDIRTLNVIGGIVFTSDFPANGQLPNKMKYTIR